MVIHAPQEEEVTSLHEMEMKLRDPGLWLNQKKLLLNIWFHFLSSSSEFGIIL